MCVHTRIKPLENLSSANQILCLVFYLPIEGLHRKRPILGSILKQVNTWCALLWLVAVNFHSKNTSNRTRIFAGKRLKSSRALQIAFIRVLQGNLSSSCQFKYFSLKNAQVGTQPLSIKLSWVSPKDKRFWSVYGVKILSCKSAVILENQIMCLTIYRVEKRSVTTALMTFRSMIQITRSTIFLLGNKASLKLVDRCWQD